MGYKTFHELLDEDQAEREGVMGVSDHALQEHPKGEPMDVKHHPLFKEGYEAGWSDGRLEGSPMAKRLSQLKSATGLACADGNWDANIYLHGMANGLILASSIMEGEEPKYLEWPKDKSTLCDVSTETLIEELKARQVKDPNNFIGVLFLSPAEAQSGLDRVRFAEGLIRQLPLDHDGRNTWLINYGTVEGGRSIYKSAIQSWMSACSIMQQSVVLSSIRGMDGMRKRHPAKDLIRYYRRCVLVSAFDGRSLLNPWEKGGGSFTGPWDHDKTHDDVINAFLDARDEMPLHYFGHFMHAAQIVGVKHSDAEVRRFWSYVYDRMVNALHLTAETIDEMEERLSDNPEAWAKREDPSANCSV